MKYISTRDAKRVVSGAQAIVEGIAPDGGLYVPESFPALKAEDWKKLLEMDYTERAAYVLSMYLDEFTYEELLGYAKDAYGRFYGEDPCPLVKVDDRQYVLELWHGPTCAFKDMALTMLPHLLTASKRKLGDEGRTLILTATSGDTGKAAMEGFRDVKGTGIIVFYPSDGVSDMQRRQMITQEGDNVCVCAIRGNFDDAQSAVKRIFTSKQAAEKLAEYGWKLSSANSINWGRLAPQIAYYISSYCDLVNAEEIEDGDKVDFVVPTGNFGDILAAYYAMRMGTPIGRLICASNSNRVLTDFFETGVYDTHRKFVETMSPSMDIIISSNLERLIFEYSGRNDKLTAARMDELKSKGKYSVTEEELKNMRGVFGMGCCDEEGTRCAIKYYFDEYGYLMDPHTAVAADVYKNAAEEEDKPCVVVSTANPYKFPSDVLEAVSGKREDDPYKAAKILCELTAAEIPEPLNDLDKKQVRFTQVIDKSEIDKFVLDRASRA